MPKPDPALLDPARYPFSCAIAPRFTDLDFHHHVNNAALADILQEGRIRFHHASAFADALDGSGISSMVVSLSIEFLGQARHPEPLDNHLAAFAVGRSSHTLGQLVTQQGNLVAYAQTVLVCVRDDQPVENPPAFLESVSKWALEL
jgi:acyl-CoA thioester hydrolase